MTDILNDTNSKICKVCNQRKLFSDMRQHSHYKHGCLRVCKKCDTEAKKKYYHKTKARRTELANNRNAAKRLLKQLPFYNE